LEISTKTIVIIIIDKISGQLIDFYEGSELRGLINQIALQ